MVPVTQRGRACPRPAGPPGPLRPWPGRPSSWPATRPSTTAGAAHGSSSSPGSAPSSPPPLGRAVLRDRRAAQGRGSEEGPASPPPSPWRRASPPTSTLEWRGEVRPLGRRRDRRAVHPTPDYWQGWVAQSRYRGRWREMVHRSALALKLLVYHPTGALVAAPTTSLPGGDRRQPQLGLPLRVAARRRVHRLRADAPRVPGGGRVVHGVDPTRCESATTEHDVMIMYTVDGTRTSPRLVLDHLDGYRGSRPVRIGNGAVGQRQLDVYGELMDSVYLFNRESADLLRPVGGAFQAAGLAGPALARARRGHLGDPRPAPALHLLGA